jgi:cysteine desulfuration protein SufE
MAQRPQKLEELLEDFSFITTRQERQAYLIELADQFNAVRVPEAIAVKPYDEANHIQECESDVYVWAQDNPDGTLTYYFDVLNPQGLSAMATSVILAKAANQAPLEQVANINADIVFDFFGKDISMGKGQGLMGIVNRIVYEAKRRLKSS